MESYHGVRRAGATVQACEYPCWLDIIYLPDLVTS
jgi:glutathione S-transferase